MFVFFTLFKTNFNIDWRQKFTSCNQGKQDYNDEHTSKTYFFLIKSVTQKDPVTINTDFTRMHTQSFHSLELLCQHINSQNSKRSQRLLRNAFALRAAWGFWCAPLGSGTSGAAAAQRRRRWSCGRSWDWWRDEGVVVVEGDAEQSPGAWPVTLHRLHLPKQTRQRLRKLRGLET